MNDEIIKFCVCDILFDRIKCVFMHRITSSIFVWLTQWKWTFITIYIAINVCTHWIYTRRNPNYLYSEWFTHVQESTATKYHLKMYNLIARELRVHVYATHTSEKFVYLFNSYFGHLLPHRISLAWNFFSHYFEAIFSIFRRPFRNDIFRM